MNCLLRNDRSRQPTLTAQRLPLYAFSNTNGAHSEHFSQAYADVLGHFREIFLSSSIGLRKPDSGNRSSPKDLNSHCMPVVSVGILRPSSSGEIRRTLSEAKGRDCEEGGETPLQLHGSRYINFGPPAVSNNFGSVNACTCSTVVSSAISRSTNPSGVTSTTANSVTI